MHFNLRLKHMEMIRAVLFLYESFQSCEVLKAFKPLLALFQGLRNTPFLVCLVTGDMWFSVCVLISSLESWDSCKEMKRKKWGCHNSWSLLCITKLIVYDPMDNHHEVITTLFHAMKFGVILDSSRYIYAWVHALIQSSTRTIGYWWH